MNPWLILNIAETDDKDAVKRAYMTELPKHNPEDDPEGFKQLRVAYEQALAEIDKKKNAESDNSPKGIFMRKVEELYRNFSRRRNPEEWAELFRDDICQRLDMEDALTESLLVFIMDNNFMPPSVYKEIDKAFSVTEKKDRLCEKFPSDFIDFFIHRTEYSALRYELFSETDTEKIDRAIYLFNSACRQFASNNLEEMKKAVKEIISLEISHPDFDMVRAKMLAWDGDKETAVDLAKPVYEMHSDDINTCLDYAYVIRGTGKRELTQEALEIYKKAREQHPDYYAPVEGLYECLMELEEYEEARLIAREACINFPSSMYFSSASMHVNKLLADEYEKKHAENPEDYETAMSLCKYYLNTERIDDCYDVLIKLPVHKDDSSYFEYMADCFMHKNQYARAIEYQLKSIEVEKLCRNYLNLAHMLNEARRFEETVKYTDEAMTLEFKDTTPTFLASICSLKGQAFHELRRYDEAIASCDEGIALKPDLQHLYTIKAEALKAQGRYALAIDACEESIKYSTFNPSPYFTEMEIFIEAGYAENALKVYERYAELEVQGDYLVYPKTLALIELSRYQEAMEVIETVLKGDIEQLKPSFLVLLGTICYHKKQFDDAYENVDAGIKAGAKNSRAYERMLDILIAQRRFEEALEWTQSSMELFDTAQFRRGEAWLYRRLGEGDTAVKKLEKAVKDFPDSYNLRRMLAEYYQSVQGEYEKSIETYRSIIANNSENPDIWDGIAYCLGQLKRYDEALKILDENIEKYPDNPFLYARRGMIYKNLSRPQEAVDDLLRAVTNTELLSECWNVADVYYYIAHLYEERFNNAAEAEKYYKLCLTVNSNDADAIGCLGDIYRNYHRDYEKAIEYHTQEISLESNKAGAHLHLAQSLALFGRLLPKNHEINTRAAEEYKIAEKILRERIMRDGGSCIDNVRLGECYLGLGKLSKAMKFFKIALCCKVKLCPQDSCHEAYFGMCLYYTLKKDFIKAKEYLDLAKSISDSVRYNSFKIEE